MTVEIQHTEMDMSGKVAEEIRALMGRRRMSGRELARQLEVSPSWISYRLSGSQPIDVNDMQQIAAALGVRLVELLPREEREASTRKVRDPLEARVIAKIGQPAGRRKRPGTFGGLPTTRAVAQTRPAVQSTRPVSLVATA